MTYLKTVVVARLEDVTPDHLPVLMLACDNCNKPCWIEGDETNTELMEMQHVCAPCMQTLVAEDPSIQERHLGRYPLNSTRMPIDSHYADQATTAAAALLRAHQNRDKN
jgi:hypothetical protein